MEKFNAMRTRLLQDLQKKTIWFKSIVALTCLLLTSASAFAQTKTVTGTVTDGTALKSLQNNFNGAKWFIEGDIKGFFDNIDRKSVV